MIYLYAFLCGGILCVIAQLLIDKTKLSPANILVSYVCVGVIMTAVGVYEPFVNFAGGGATVPLTGFGYALAKGVEKAIGEQGLFGALTGGMSATSGGVTTAVIFAVIWSLIFKSREK